MLDSSYEAFETLNLKRKGYYVLVFYVVGCMFYMSYENWTLIDSIYFITVTITSVGYGDLEPSTTLCRCFTIFYAIIGLAAIFGIVGEAITQYLEHIQSKALHEAASGKDIRREQNLKIYLSILAIILTIVGGGLCYSFLESWSFMDAIYFAAMTTLTVGYGDLAVTSQKARLFSIFYMTLSVMVFAVAVGNFQAVGIARSLEERRQEMLSKELDLEALFRLDEDGDGKVTLIEFLTGAMQQISGIDPEKEIHPWIRRFHELDADGNGYLDQNDLKMISVNKVPGIAAVNGLCSKTPNAAVGNDTNNGQQIPLLSKHTNLHNDYNSV